MFWVFYLVFVVGKSVVLALFLLYCLMELTFA